MSRLRMLLVVSVALAGIGAGSAGFAASGGQGADGLVAGAPGLLTSADRGTTVQADGIAAPALVALSPWNVHAGGVLPASGLGSFGRFDTLVSDQFRTITPFAGSVETALGLVTASGYAVRTKAPLLFADGADRLRYDLQDFTLSAALSPGVRLDLGYNVDMAGPLGGYAGLNASAYDRLFFSGPALASPYASLSDGGNYVGASFALSRHLHVSLAAASLAPRQADYTVPTALKLIEVQGRNPALAPRKAKSTLVSVMWDFAKWGSLGLTAGQTREENGLLGNASDSAGLMDRVKTTSVGLSAHLGLGAGWVTTFSYNEGISQLNLRPEGGSLGASDTLRSNAYSVTIAKHGLFSGNDALGLALSRPLQIYGNGSSTVPVSLATAPTSGNHDVLIARNHLLPPSSTPETDVELGYVTTFFDGALALQANAGYQMNLAGQKGQNAVTVLSRAKINF